MHNEDAMATDKLAEGIRIARDPEGGRLIGPAASEEMML
jgi:hypothetical protein